MFVTALHRAQHLIGLFAVSTISLVFNYIVLFAGHCLEIVVFQMINVF